MSQVQIKQDNLTFGAFTLTPTGLTTVGVPKFKEWLACGDFIQKANKSVHFWLGDWLRFGEGAYGEMYTQAMDETKYAYDTLSRDKWIASRIESCRRRQNLTFSHHQEVADLEPEEQDKMLDMAEKNKMTTAEFRKAVRHYKLKLDVPEMNEEQLKPTDPILFQKAQEIIDSSIHTIELLEQLEWESMDPGAKDWLVSHLKKAGTFFFGLVQKYDKQKRLSK